MDIEIRYVPVLELRVTDGDMPKIVGHAAVFNSLSEDLGGFREQIAPGAFSRALREGQDVRALFNHDRNFVLGRSEAKTLRLSEDDRGLAFEIDPPDAEWARALMSSIRRGDISGNSFSFRAQDERWEKKQDGTSLRTLLDLDVYDIGPVTYPAYPKTDVAVRSLERWEKENGIVVPTVSFRKKALHVRTLE